MLKEYVSGRDVQTRDLRMLDKMIHLPVRGEKLRDSPYLHVKEVRYPKLGNENNIRKLAAEEMRYNKRGAYYF